jgi:hypothetical protein
MVFDEMIERVISESRESEIISKADLRPGTPAATARLMYRCAEDLVLELIRGTATDDEVKTWSAEMDALVGRLRKAVKRYGLSPRPRSGDSDDDD